MQSCDSRKTMKENPDRKKIAVTWMIEAWRKNLGSKRSNDVFIFG